MVSERDIMIAGLVAALVGVFVGAIMTVAFLRRYRRRELPEFAFMTTPMTRAKSSTGWRSPSPQSFSSQLPSSPLRKIISEPMLLKDFEGKRVILPPHISEMLGISSKQACSKIPLSISPTTTLRELSLEPGLDEASRQLGVPMLLRQPRKSTRSLRRGFGSTHSIASLESMYSEASAPSYKHPTSVRAAPPDSSLLLSARGGNFEIVPVYKTEQPDSFYRALTPSAITMAGASLGVLDQSNMENSHSSPPGLSSQHRPYNIGPPPQVPVDYASRSREPASSLPDIPPRSPLRCKSVPNLK
ncbi:hypothetical protein APHAL10511_003736 [Amanita phalloides]|nr:hypothetical protein APHAL10511_003736 [Amanita phalloides]